jgi:hypothetical protein
VQAKKDVLMLMSLSKERVSAEKEKTKEYQTFT